MMRKFLAALAICALSGHGAHAQTISGVQGQVLVSNGNGFLSVQSGTPVDAGARVLLQPNSTAFVVFPNGAVVNLTPGVVYTVPSIAPIASTAGGAAGAVGGISNTTLIGGAAVAAGAGVVIYFATKSTSP